MNKRFREILGIVLTSVVTVITVYFLIILMHWVGVNSGASEEIYSTAVIMGFMIIILITALTTAVFVGITTLIGYLREKSDDT